MYTLQVFFPGDRLPGRSEYLDGARDALARVPELLSEHDGCEKIVVFFGTTRLFSVDCKGNSSPA